MKKKLEIYGFCNKGYEGQIINIQCDIRNGFPGFDIIGLPDKAINESKERVRSALRNSGFKFPQSRVLVSLSPAGIPKSGSLLDLGIALSILFAQMGNNDAESNVLRVMTAGELSLTGNILEDSSALGAIECAKRLKCALCIVPQNCRCDNKMVISTPNLKDAFLLCGEFFNKKEDITFLETDRKVKERIFSDIIGLNKEKEILSMAASGFHSCLLFGPPGVGKTMLCSRMNRLLPPLTENEKQTIKHIYGCASINIEDVEQANLISVPHDCSAGQFVMGNITKAPGIGALAHGGVLLLDEITKYTPALRESVKESYDKGTISSSRSGEEISYPARFLMVANLNPCSCGGLGSSQKPCLCTSQKVLNHWNKIGNPLLERFDIRLPIEETDISNLICEKSHEDSYYIDKMLMSRQRQNYRYKNFPDISCNGQLHYNTSALSLFLDQIELLHKIAKDSNTVKNTRSLLGIISLSRTIADYKDKDKVDEEDVVSALRLRQFGNGDFYWKVVQ